MAENWYYVHKGNRQGPVGQDVIASMISAQELKAEDFVWKKGFDNWKKIKDVSELQEAPASVPIPASESKPTPVTPGLVTAANVEEEFSLSSLGEDDRCLYIRVGNDRGEAPADYGPFSVNQIKRLFKENRINGKTFIFATGMQEWKVLGDIPEYQELFDELPPEIRDTDRRAGTRKPFVARLFIQSNKRLFEGLCRDISIGGMQVLVPDFFGHAGDKITINVHPDNTEYNFAASGVVVRVLEGNSGFSFRFQNLNDEAKRAIEKYIQDN